MTRKVIYVSYVRLIDSFARDRYIDNLIARGVNVEYWDVVSLVFGDDGHNSKQVDYLRTPGTHDEMEAMVRLPENRDALYIMMLGYEISTARLYRMLSKYDCRMISIMWGMMPIYGNQVRGLSGMFRRMLNPAASLRALLNKAILIGYRKLNQVKPFDVVFAAGQVLATAGHYANKVVPINIADYDYYVKTKSNPGRVVEGRYAVFLDTYTPYHPDFTVLGMRHVEPHQYFLVLNRFFSLLEEKYKIKIVIAAHPKSNYGDNPFQGRTIYRGMTPELVRDANFVVSHNSTAVGCAVLNSKPVIFAYTNEMESLYRDTLTRGIIELSQYLDAEIYNVDEITQCDQIAIREVNKERYENYKYNFLTTRKSEHTTTWEIFWREINAI